MDIQNEINKLNSINNIKEKTKIFLKNNKAIIKYQKNIIIILTKLLDLFNQLYIINNMNEINRIKNSIISFLKEEKYESKEFYILNTDTFNDSSLFYDILLNNLYFYISDIIYKYKYVNIYYYLFHLVYYILEIIINNFNFNFYNDDIKFYIYHIIHFFQNDYKAVEYNFFSMNVLLNFYLKNIK